MLVQYYTLSMLTALQFLAEQRMKRQHVLLSILFLVGSLPLYAHVLAMQQEKRDVYIVYMGAIPDVSSTADDLKESHLQLLTSILQREQQADKTLVRSYRHGFSGFAARLSSQEALAIEKTAGVVSVFVDPTCQLHTTRSWEFLQQTYAEVGDSGRNADDHGAPPSSPSGSDVIIGFLDTGIWPESESFADRGIGEIPSRWKGTCMEGTNFTTSNCNKKLIGARYYQEGDVAAAPAERTNDNSPRDCVGHGTHTASTAAGNLVMDASYYGLAAGTAKGGSAGSRIAMYRVCSMDVCSGSEILAGFDDAIADGVDILSVSLGIPASDLRDFWTDPIAIGAFHAVEKGIMVVCSAGNDGPNAGSVVNDAPWILTVAATTIDRDFESDVVLGGSNVVNKAIKGEAINFSSLKKAPIYPLIVGEAASSNSSSTLASHCELNSLDADKIEGYIVLCKHLMNDTFKIAKVENLKSSGAIGAILINDLERAVATSYVSFPVTEITSQAAGDILAYINSTDYPVATISPTITVTRYKPAPQVAYFSARGPSHHTSNILKPDIAAPGVNILASWIPEYSSCPAGQKPSAFNLESGTSMACPHIAGVAATIKERNPRWSPSAIRSAIMTTATQMNNDNSQLTADSGSSAVPYDCGAGEVRPKHALDPGLVFELETQDYLRFLCNYGYESSTIKLMATIPDDFECPKNSSRDLISELNYPSIAISNFSTHASMTVNRIVTNVGPEVEITYAVCIKSPSEIDVRVVPDKLQFTKNSNKLSYKVIFSALDSTIKGDYFGSITWSDGRHRVTSPFVVRGE